MCGPTAPPLMPATMRNPHGAGVAWREDGVVRWFKGLEPRELEPLIAGLSGEIVIHFRWASVGEVTPKLCHPFPVSAKATTRLSGHARAVLFHNGTWCQWRETLRRMPKHRMPDGLLSDTRVAASLVDLCGMDVFDRLPGTLGVLRPRFHRTLRRLARVARHEGEQPRVHLWPEQAVSFCAQRYAVCG